MTSVPAVPSLFSGTLFTSQENAREAGHCGGRLFGVVRLHLRGWTIQRRKNLQFCYATAQLLSRLNVLVAVVLRAQGSNALFHVRFELEPQRRLALKLRD